jgi:haloacetate dehalogenase
VREYVRCFSAPETIRASCADYRAALTIDLEHDDASADEGQKITCPLMALWGDNGFVGRNYDVLETWQPYADHVTGHGLPCGHHLPEEAAAETVDALRTFLS